MTAPSELDDWAAELAAALQLTGFEVDIPLVLDLARDAAHGVAWSGSVIPSLPVWVPIAPRPCSRPVSPTAGPSAAA